MNLDELQAQRRLYVRKRMGRTAAQYDVYGQDGGGPVAFARSKRLDPEAETMIYRDDTRRHPLLTVKARKEHPPDQARDVTDPDGRGIGVIRCPAGSLLGRRTWLLAQPGAGELAGRERSGPVAMLRFTGTFSWLPSRFDFAAGGRGGFSVRKRAGMPTRFVVDIPDPELDRRLVLAATLLL